jgi:hypothetical protein
MTFGRLEGAKPVLLIPKKKASRRNHADYFSGCAIS